MSAVYALSLKIQVVEWVLPEYMLLLKIIQALWRHSRSVFRLHLLIYKCGPYFFYKNKWKGEGNGRHREKTDKMEMRNKAKQNRKEWKERDADWGIGNEEQSKRVGSKVKEEREGIPIFLKAVKSHLGGSWGHFVGDSPEYLFLQSLETREDLALLFSYLLLDYLNFLMP